MRIVKVESATYPANLRDTWGGNNRCTETAAESRFLPRQENLRWKARQRPPA
jgi:hypothetical protein